MGKEKVIMRNGWEGMGENEESIHRSGEERRGKRKGRERFPHFLLYSSNTVKDAAWCRKPAGAWWSEVACCRDL